jgi:hypothetical protein
MRAQWRTFGALIAMLGLCACVVRPAATGDRVASSSIDPPFDIVMPQGWEPWSGATWFSLKQVAPGGSFRIEIVVTTLQDAMRSQMGCEVPAGITVPAGVDGLVASLTADPSVAVSPRGSLTVGGFPGQALDVGLVPTWTGTCTKSPDKQAAQVQSWLYLEAGWRHRVVLVDVRGTMLIISIWAADPAQLESAANEAMPIVESIRLHP